VSATILHKISVHTLTQSLGYHIEMGGMNRVCRRVKTRVPVCQLLSGSWRGRLNGEAGGNSDAVTHILSDSLVVRVIIRSVTRAVGVALLDCELIDEYCVSRRLLLSMHNQTLVLILEMLI
jgi:hypothetical protein